MTFLFMKLLAVHLIADFVLLPRPHGPLGRRFPARVFWLGLAAHVGLGLFVLPLVSIGGLPLIAAVLHVFFRFCWSNIPNSWLTHDDIDRRRNRRLAAFILRQLGHLLIIGVSLPISQLLGSGEGLNYVLRALLYDGNVRGGGDTLFLSVAPFDWLIGDSLAALTLVMLSGFVLAVSVGARVIEILIEPFVVELNNARKAHPEEIRPAGFPNGARVIGHWERAIIFLLVVSGHVAGVAFLAAAKSIFRFGELKDANQRREAEFILIGTLMSFSWALAVALLTKYLATLWFAQIFARS